MAISSVDIGNPVYEASQESCSFGKATFKEYLSDKDGNETYFQIGYDYFHRNGEYSIVRCEVNPIGEHNMSDEELRESVRVLLCDPRHNDTDVWRMDCKIIVNEFSL
jgi:hypothetical protein